MLRKLFTLIVCLVAAVATVSAQTPPDNEIWYTTTGGRPIFFYDDDLVSNSYNNGRGVLKFRNSVTSIEYGAFEGSSSLKSITIPNSVTEIGISAFNGCSSLKSITIPNSVTSIGWHAFSGCSSLTSITIPNSVTSIEGSTFYGCSSLISITIPNSVTSIESWAFEGCSSLTSITIPNSVTSIGEEAFTGCSSLKSFKGKFASEDGRCLIKDGELIAFAPAGLTSYAIPNSVTEIGGYAFGGCSSLTSITIPNSVTSIGEWAFEGCSSLISITIPNSVTEIGDYAFGGCSSLTGITIPNSVKSIGDGAFGGCSSLTSITIPNSVTSIGEMAFDGCSSLKSFNGKFASEDGRCLIKDGELIAFAPAVWTSYTIPNSVTEIGDYAFGGCSSLTSITIPESVTSIGDDAFYGCSSLKSITIGNSVTKIGSDAFRGCRYLKSVKVSNKYCYDYFKKLGVSDITFAVSTLEEYQEAQKLGVKKLAIDSNSKYASEDGLCLIDNGKLILFIGKDLTEYPIPEGVTSFREEAFEGCNGLKSVKVANKYCYDYFKDKVADIAFYGANASADGRCLIIDGELKIFIAKGITEYTIPEGVTSVGDNAFRNYNRLTSITIPDSVAEIGRGAFSGCSSLTSITIPESVTSIGYETFSDCSNLTVINCMASTPPAISDLCIPSEVIIYVPKGAIRAYKKDENWMQYKKQIKLIK